MTKPFVFTLMPFDSSFDDLYKFGIKATCEELSSYCERVDEQIFQGSILDRILNQISKADVVIADMSGRNPNVFFEVGYAKALDKKLILLTSSSKDIPFDLKHYTHIVYDSSIVKLRETLRKNLQFYFSNPDKSQSDLLPGLNLYVCGIKLLEGALTSVEVPVKFNAVPLTIENVSGKTIEEKTMQIVVKGADHWALENHKERKFIIDRNNEEKWSLLNQSPIFHGSEETYGICSTAYAGKEGKLINIIIYTKNGKSSYDLEILPKKANNAN